MVEVRSTTSKNLESTVDSSASVKTFVTAIKSSTRRATVSPNRMVGAVSRRSSEGKDEAGREEEEEALY